MQKHSEVRTVPSFCRFFFYNKFHMTVLKLVVPDQGEIWFRQRSRHKKTIGIILSFFHSSIRHPSKHIYIYIYMTKKRYPYINQVHGILYCCGNENMTFSQAVGNIITPILSASCVLLSPQRTCRR